MQRQHGIPLRQAQRGDLHGVAGRSTRVDRFGEAKGEDDVLCLLLQCLYGLKQVSRVWNETIDNHLKSMGFKAVDADPCVYTRGEGDNECIVYLYVDDIVIAAKEKAGIAEKFNTKYLGRARFIIGIKIDYDMECNTL
ncbi:hypothetical protein PC128_g676 [Phytophthora cactorum]|nr:hypothetical protein PC128_g676 [Phytophthora cactorum]